MKNEIGFEFLRLSHENSQHVHAIILFFWIIFISERERISDEQKQ